MTAPAGTSRRGTGKLLFLLFLAVIAFGTATMRAATMHMFAAMFDDTWHTLFN